MVSVFARCASLGAGILFSGGGAVTLAYLLHTDPLTKPADPIWAPVAVFAVICLLGGIAIGLVAVAIRHARSK